MGSDTYDVCVDVPVDCGLDCAGNGSGKVAGNRSGEVSSDSGCRRGRRRRSRSDSRLAQTVDPPARSVVAFAQRGIACGLVGLFERMSAAIQQRGKNDRLTTGIAKFQGTPSIGITVGSSSHRISRLRLMSLRIYRRMASGW